MGIGNDSFELKKMFDGAVFETPVTAPTKPATEPTTKPGAPDQKPKPRSPIAPKPGTMPMPKPKAQNKDVGLFLRQRGLNNA